MPETLSIIRTLCTLLQEPNPAQFAHILHNKKEHVEKLENDVHQLTQKNTYRDLLSKRTPLIEQPKLSEDSYDQLTKHLTSTFHKIFRFLTDAEQLLDLLKLLLSTLPFDTTHLNLHGLQLTPFSFGH